MVGCGRLARPHVQALYAPAAGNHVLRRSRIGRQDYDCYWQWPLTGAGKSITVHSQVHPKRGPVCSRQKGAIGSIYQSRQPGNVGGPSAGAPSAEVRPASEEVNTVREKAPDSSPEQQAVPTTGGQARRRGCSLCPAADHRTGSGGRRARATTGGRAPRRGTRLHPERQADPRVRGHYELSRRRVQRRAR